LTQVVFGNDAGFSRRRLASGETLVEQGDPGSEMFLLLDGSLDVEIDGETIAQVGSGAVVGELALLGDGRRQATLRAARPSRVAVLGREQVEGTRLAELALARRLAAG
jgi:CRP-like cAMP-binding protein